MNRFLLYTVLLFHPVFIEAQQIKHLGVTEGLDGLQAFRVTQDKKGFIWISNRFGVDRYDGRKIKNYTIPILTTNYPVLSMDVLTDNDTVVWIYTNRGGIYCYNEYTDAFEIYKNLDSFLRTLSFDEENHIWFGTNNLFGYIKNNVVIEIIHPLLNDRLVKKIIHYRSQEKLIITDHSVLLYDIPSKKLRHFFEKNGQDIIASMQVETAYYDRERAQLWIGTINRGVLLYTTETKSFKQIECLKESNVPVMSVVPVNDSAVFVGTDGMGAWLIDRDKHNLIKVYRHGDASEKALSGDGIYDIFKDRENRIWMSTYSGGVNIIDFDYQGFLTEGYLPGNPDLLSKDIINCMMEDSRHNLWFGTDNGLVFKNVISNQWMHFLKSNYVLDVFEDSRKELWVGTYGSGIYVLDRNGRLLRHFTQNDNSQNTLGTNFVYCIIEDSLENIWIGGKKGELTKYDRKTDTFVQFPLKQVNSFTIKDKDMIWVASESGIYNLFVQEDKIVGSPFNSRLTSKYVCDIYRESDSIFWFASYGGGLARCNYLTNDIRYITKASGLASDIIYSILPDRQHYLWLSTEAGISKICMSSFSVENYSRYIPAVMSYRQRSRMITANGELFFGAYNGLVSFYPERIVSKPAPVKLFFSNLSLFNRVTKPGEKNSPLKEPLDNVSEIELSYKEHSFSLDFTTIDYTQTGSRQYMWKLEGLDQDWVGPSTENVVNYTNLSPRRYVFRLKAMDENRLVLDERQLEIIIRPPLWDTPWARLLEILLIALLLYGIYKYIRYIYDKKRSDEKIRFFINTTHDLRTPLTLISAPLFELKERLCLDKWNSYLFELITGNLDKLNKIISQLLDFQKTYEQEERLVLSQQELEPYLMEKIMYWKPVALKKEIALNMECPQDSLSEWFDVEKMDKVLDNLIFNAIKYTASHGHITVKLTCTSQHWQITVSDDGIGIPKSDIAKMFRRFYRAENAVNFQESGSGLGLLLVKNYVTLHGGQVGVSSVEGTGSDFFIRLKRGVSHFTNAVMLDNAGLPMISDKDQPENDDQDKMKIKLLIVEDNKDLREYLKMSLGYYYNTYSAVNGKEAWDNMHTINPDIIVSDLNMPLMDGLELCRKVKTTYDTSHIPVILLTVMIEKQNVEAGLKTGADDYILKPFDVKYLRIKIDNIINNRKILRAKFLSMDKQPSSGETGDSLNEAFVDKATQIIHNYLTDTDFSVSDLSKKMGMSRSLLYTKFNAVTGYSPNDFIKIVRMKKAILLFREKKYSINEVAYMTGFGEPSYFTTCFKKIYGKTPKQFIEEEIGGKANGRNYAEGAK